MEIKTRGAFWLRGFQGFGVLLWYILVERRCIDLPTFALRTRCHAQCIRLPTCRCDSGLNFVSGPNTSSR